LDIGSLIPPQRKLYLIDSFRGQYSNVVENLIRWYREECTRCGKTCNIDEWNVISAQNLPFLLPIQTHGTSCGVFTGMTAYYWITQQRLPSTSDWNQSCVPQMRKFMLHLISRSNRINEAYIQLYEGQTSQFSPQEIEAIKSHINQGLDQIQL